MSVAIRPASLSAHSMFAAIAQMSHSGEANTVAPLHNKADLWAELNQWLQQ